MFEYVWEKKSSGSKRFLYKFKNPFICYINACEFIHQKLLKMKKALCKARPGKEYHHGPVKIYDNEATSQNICIYRCIYIILYIYAKYFVFKKPLTLCLAIKQTVYDLIDSRACPAAYAWLEDAAPYGPSNTPQISLNSGRNCGDVSQHRSRRPV